MSVADRFVYVWCRLSLCTIVSLFAVWAVPLLWDPVSDLAWLPAWSVLLTYLVIAMIAAVPYSAVCAFLAAWIPLLRNPAGMTTLTLILGLALSWVLEQTVGSRNWLELAIRAVAPAALLAVVLLRDRILARREAGV